MARLLRRRGYAASGLKEIVADSGAPKGSLYFHFPGGKEQLAVAAIDHSGEQLRGAIAAVRAGTKGGPRRTLAALIDALAAGLESSGYRDGCPIATVALETAAESDAVRAAADGAFSSWLAELEAMFRESGMSRAGSRRRALHALAAIEGALILARARRDPEPLHAVRSELLAMD